MSDAEVAAVATTDPLIVAIVSVALTLIVSVVVGLLTAWLSRRGEHAKWLRERRFDAYLAFMIDMDAFVELASNTSKPTSATVARLEKLFERFSASHEAVSLLGPKRVNAAGQKWIWAAGEVRDLHDRTAASAARWQFLIAAGGVLRSLNVGREPLKKPAEDSGENNTVAL